MSTPPIQADWRPYAGKRISVGRWLLSSFLLWMFAIGAFVHAEETPTLSLEDALQLAVNNHPRLLAEQAFLDVSAAGIVQAGKRPNPTLATDTGMVEDTYRLGVGQLLETGGKRRKRIALAEARQALAREELANRLDDLQIRIRQAFVALYILQAESNALNTLLNTLNPLYQGEQPNSPDQVASQLRLGQLKNKAVQLEAFRMEARHELAVQIGQPLPSSIRLLPPALPDSKTTLQSESGAPPSMTSQPQPSSAMQAAEREIELAKANRIPDLFVGAGIALTTGDDRRFGLYAVGSVDLPIFDRNQGELQEARALKRQVRLEEAAATHEQQITSHLQQEKQSLYYQQLQQYEFDTLPACQRLTETARQQHKQGILPFSSVLDSHQHCHDTYTQYLQTLRALYLMEWRPAQQPFTLPEQPDWPPMPQSPDQD